MDRPAPARRIREEDVNAGCPFRKYQEFRRPCDATITSDDEVAARGVGGMHHRAWLDAHAAGYEREHRRFDRSCSSTAADGGSQFRLGIGDQPRVDGRSRFRAGAAVEHHAQATALEQETGRRETRRVHRAHTEKGQTQLPRPGVGPRPQAGRGGAPGSDSRFSPWKISETDWSVKTARITDAISGATDTTVNLEGLASARSGSVSVTTTSLSADSSSRCRAGGENTACVATAITSTAPACSSLGTTFVTVPAVSIMSSTITQRRPRTSPISPTASETLRTSARRTFCMKAMPQSRCAAYFCAILPRPGSGATTTKLSQALLRT